MAVNKVRFGDVAAAVLFAAAIIFSFLMMKSGTGENRRLTVYSCGDEYVFPLDRDGRYEIKGLLGVSIVTVEDGGARFEDSPCPNKTCVQCGVLFEPGSWAACLPNDVFIRIESDDDEVDAVAF